MIQGLNAGYSPAYYIVLDDLIWRYDGVCVDKLVSYGRTRTEAEFKALQERIKKSQWDISQAQRITRKIRGRE